MTARDIAGALPDIDSLKDLCRSMAMAEAILNPDGECFYSYSAEWSETEQVASMRNGSGDEYDIVFAPVGGYEVSVDVELVRHIYPATARTGRIMGLHPSVSAESTIESAVAAAKMIGCPLALDWLSDGV